MANTGKPSSVGEVVPHFFISYARLDLNQYLKRFFVDLRNRVASLLDVSPDHVAFLDTNNIDTGIDWDSKIAKAAQLSKVLVCIYSPNYFSRNKNHEYCAKEFSAFLKRQDRLRYECYVEANVELFRLRDVRNIVPILWYSETFLKKSGDLPPPMVRMIHYHLRGVDSEIADAYKTKGMERITTRRSGTYLDIIQALAGTIHDCSKNPLPPLSDAPEFSTLRNAFWDRPERIEVDTRHRRVDSIITDTTELGLPEAPHIQTGSRDYQGPGQVLAIEVRSRADKESAWTPYGGRQNISGLLEEIVAERQLAYRSELLDPTDPDFLIQVQEILSAATATNTIAIVLLDPLCLGNEVVRDKVEGLIREGTWRGGVVIPIGSFNAEALSITEQFRDVLEVPPEHQQRIVIRRSSGSVVDFRIALLSVLDGILARIVKHGEVHQKIPDNPGPKTKPSITNVHTLKLP
jgi:TIR domain